MNVRTLPALVLLVAGLSAAAPQALAQTGFYLGANAGVTRAEIDEDAINQAVISVGGAGPATTSDQSGTGFKAYGGYSFTPNVAVEFGYFDLGKFTTSTTTSNLGSVDAEMKFKGFNVDVVGRIPLGDSFALFGRVGVINTKQDVRASGSTGAVLTEDTSKTSWKAGIGVEYMITGGLGVRAEGEIYNVPDGPDDKANVGLLSVGLLYRF